MSIIRLARIIGTAGIVVGPATRGDGSDANIPNTFPDKPTGSDKSGN